MFSFTGYRRFQKKLTNLVILEPCMDDWKLKFFGPCFKIVGWPELVCAILVLAGVFGSGVQVIYRLHHSFVQGSGFAFGITSSLGVKFQKTFIHAPDSTDSRSLQPVHASVLVPRFQRSCTPTGAAGSVSGIVDPPKQSL